MCAVPTEEGSIEKAPAPNLPEPQYTVLETVISRDETNAIRVYQPDGPGPWPIVYGIPGSSGSAERDLGTVAFELARRGVLVFVTDWVAEADPEGALADAECGYRLAWSIAEEYGGSTSMPVTMLGFSLGATTALDLTLGENRFGTGWEYMHCFTGVPRPSVTVALAGCHTELGFGADTTGWGNRDASIRNEFGFALAPGGFGSSMTAN